MHFRKSRVFHIGLDDTDSADGMCTTFLAYNLVQTLSRLDGKSKLIDYPNLIRLNPNIPWKTRGNGALVLRTESELGKEEIFKVCKDLVDRFATSDNANAGLVIHEGEDVPEKVRDFSRRALSSVLSVREAEKLIENSGMSSYGLRARQGLIGSLAGIGNELRRDFTFELIAYRRNVLVPRSVDKSKVLEMNRKTVPRTFNSYDEENDRVLILPHGPDPVLLGIRGEKPSAVRDAFQMLQPINNLLGYMIFRSNQGTGEHLQTELDLGLPKAYSSGRTEGEVISKPTMQMGGHVFFELGNSQGKILCACYEPTGKLRNVAMSLLVGDRIEVGGGVRKSTSRHPKVLNLEYVLPLELIEKIAYENPKCAKCRVSLSSEGRSQGFQCPKCGALNRAGQKTVIVQSRPIKEGLLYLPDLKAHRHLTKPLQRYLHETSRRPTGQNLVKNWIRVE